jgi:hypothetical protein
MRSAAARHILFVSHGASFADLTERSAGIGRTDTRRTVLMAELYNMCQRLMQRVEAANPDPMALLMVKGQIAREAGFMVSLVSANDTDDPVKIEGVRRAARTLGIDL